MTFRPSTLMSLVLASTLIALTGCATHPNQAGIPAATVSALTEQTPELGTFSKLARQAGLQATLEAAGPVTVFVPTDEAFKALPPATLDKLSRDPEFLKSVLSYHVVPGLTKSADIEGAKALTTANGARVNVSKAGDFVTVDEALVTRADLRAGNGVVHVVDSVLMPPKK
ncbi:MAG: fasciclin domain-containing protein [Aquabacterium sp.]